MRSKIVDFRLDNGAQSADSSRIFDPQTTQDRQRWAELEARYYSLRQEIDALQGKLDTEEAADKLWDELQRLFNHIAVMRAHTDTQIILKLRAAADMLDESADRSLADLLSSAIDDLAIRI